MNEKRSRMRFEANEVTIRAIRIRAAAEGKSSSEVILDALEKHLHKELNLAKEFIKQQSAKGKQK